MESASDESLNETALEVPKIRKVTWISIVVLVIIVCGLQLQQMLVTVTLCEQSNATIVNLEKFIDSSLDRSRLVNQATLEAPQSTPAQKLAAQKALEQLDQLVKDEHGTLALKTCSYPPR